MSTYWQAVAASEGVYEGRDRTQDECGQVDRHPGRPHLRFALAAPRFAEVYACADSKEKFVKGLRGCLDEGDER